MSILLVVVGSLLSVFDSMQKTQAFITARSEGLDDLRTAMDKLTKELRQATAISAGSSGTSLTMTTYVNGAPATVTWRYNNGRLERVNAAGQVAARLSSVGTATPFTYSPSVTSPSIIRVDLTLHPSQSPQTTLELVSEIRLRNL